MNLVIVLIECTADLRRVPTFVTAHTFWASQDTRVSYGWCLLTQGYFWQFKIMRRKQYFASVLSIKKKKKKKTGGNHALFRNN